MKERPRKEMPRPSDRRGVEMVFFLVVSAIGIFALGNGLSGLFESGKAIDLLWLAVSAATMVILFTQMGRVHDSWPRRPSQKAAESAMSAGKETLISSSEHADAKEGRLL